MSDPTITPIVIKNRALARIGGGEIVAEDENTELARQVDAIYQDRIDAVLGGYPWSFAKKTYRLDALAKTAANGFDSDLLVFPTGWPHGFLLPGDRLSTPRKVMADPRNPDVPIRDFEIEAGLIYARHDKLWATFTVRVDPDVWPPPFRIAIVTLLAADLAIPVTHDTALAAELRAYAQGTPEENGRGGLIGRAIAVDVAGAVATAPLLALDPLGNARLS